MTTLTTKQEVRIMKATNTVRFFEGLAQRMYHENDLSDMVYALCLSNTQFKQFFLDFFFKDQGLKAENASIEREVLYSDGSRPDFVIRTEGKTYFVEVKIWDRSHHFAQYANTLEKLLSQKVWCSQLGYITNYQISDGELSREDKDGKNDKSVFDTVKKNVKQWKDFIESLESSEHSSWNNGEEVQGLIAYCRKVCPDISDEPIDVYSYNPGDFKQVQQFYESLRDFLSTQLTIEARDARHIIQLDKYRVANTPAETIGFYFGAVDDTGGMDEGQKMLSGKKIWGWVGLRLKNSDSRESNAGLCVAFDNIEGWGKPVFDALNDNSQWLPFYFDLPADNQWEKEVFKNAFESVFKILIGLDQRQSVFQTNSGYDVVNTPYYAIRKLPLFIRQKVFPKLHIDGFRISPFFQKDAFNPSGWCGEYFSVIKNPQLDDEEGKEVGRFWVGTYYDAGRENCGIVCEQIGRDKKTLIEYDTKVQNVDADSLCEAINQFVSECISGKNNPS